MTAEGETGKSGPAGQGAPSAPAGDRTGERVAKVIARAGVASRRDADGLIAAGRVAVNGTVLDTPAVLVTDDDLVTVDGTPLPAREPARLWRYHKPGGLVTTTRDEKGRDTVFDHLPAGLPRVVTVGRLDLTSEGLLLLTNDGGLKRQLELPANAWVRRYRVRVYGTPSAEALAALGQGVTVDGVRYGPIEASLDKQQGGNAWLTVALKEGKNREIRRVMEYLGLPVSRLIRTSYGPFHLGLLGKGAVEEVPPRALKDMVRGAVAGEAADRETADKAAVRAARRGRPAATSPNPTPEPPPTKDKRTARSAAGKPASAAAGKAPARSQGRSAPQPPSDRSTKPKATGKRPVGAAGPGKTAGPGKSAGLGRAAVAGPASGPDKPNRSGAAGRPFKAPAKPAASPMTRSSAKPPPSGRGGRRK